MKSERAMKREQFRTLKRIAPIFHDACVCIINSELFDDYSKAMAQVGLGLWDDATIRIQANNLLIQFDWNAETRDVQHALTKCAIA